MATTVVTRGNVQEFSTNFYDANGDLVIPETAVMRINFVGGTYRQVINLPMALSATDGPWVVDWDTSVAGARPGLVYWSAQGLNPAGAEDGQFELDANPANQGT